MMNRFKLVVPSFNSVDYIDKTLSSIEMQTDKEYDVCVIDDGSTIKKQKEIISFYCEKNGWKSLFNQKNEGALYGMVKAIPLLDCQDQDVIVVIDGDDWLAHSDALKKLREIYQEDVYLTWGQCEVYPRGKTAMNYAQPIPEMVVNEKLYRDIPFVFWHIETFKYFLWKHIEDQDLRDEDGEYFKIMKDKATFYPMLEMAGEKIRFVNETLYIYNLENPLNDYANTRPEEHLRVDSFIRKKNRYSRLRFPDE